MRQVVIQFRVCLSTALGKHPTGLVEIDRLIAPCSNTIRSLMNWWNRSNDNASTVIFIDGKRHAVPLVEIESSTQLRRKRNLTFARDDRLKRWHT